LYRKCLNFINETTLYAHTWICGYDRFLRFAIYIYRLILYVRLFFYVGHLYNLLLCMFYMYNLLLSTWLLYLCR